MKTSQPILVTQTISRSSDSANPLVCPKRAGSLFPALSIRVVATLLILLPLSPQLMAQLVTYNTVGNLGTETTEPTVSVASNATATALSLGSVTPGANGNRFGGSNWFDTGDTAAGTTLAESIAGNDYIEFMVTPMPGFQIDATGFDFIWDRSSTGPSAVALRSSADAFANNLGIVTGLASGGAATTTTNTISFTLSSLSAVTFRLYGYNATATTGTGGFDTANGATSPNVVLNGSVSVVPEPSSLLAGLGLLGIAGYRERRKEADARRTSRVVFS